MVKKFLNRQQIITSMLCSALVIATHNSTTLAMEQELPKNNKLEQTLAKRTIKTNIKKLIEIVKDKSETQKINKCIEQIIRLLFDKSMLTAMNIKHNRIPYFIKDIDKARDLLIDILCARQTNQSIKEKEATIRTALDLDKLEQYCLKNSQLNRFILITNALTVLKKYVTDQHITVDDRLQIFNWQVIEHEIGTDDANLIKIVLIWICSESAEPTYFSQIVSKLSNNNVWRAQAAAASASIALLAWSLRNTYCSTCLETVTAHSWLPGMLGITVLAATAGTYYALNDLTLFKKIHTNIICNKAHRMYNNTKQQMSNLAIRIITILQNIEARDTRNQQHSAQQNIQPINQ